MEENFRSNPQSTTNSTIKKRRQDVSAIRSEALKDIYSKNRQFFNKEAEFHSFLNIQFF